MDILATRTMTYTGTDGARHALQFTVYRPRELQSNAWRCGFAFGPPIDREPVSVGGIDFIQALIGCLEVARGYLQGSRLSGQVQWQGMLHCGLPAHGNARLTYSPSSIPQAQPNPGTLTELTTRSLGAPDETGTERALVLTVFVPSQSEDGQCACAFAIGSTDTIRYGTGADEIEAMLDAFAMARSAYEAMLPRGWQASESSTVLDCAGLPRKVGREFWLDMVGDLGADAPDALKQWGR